MKEKSNLFKVLGLVIALLTLLFGSNILGRLGPKSNGEKLSEATEISMNNSNIETISNEIVRSISKLDFYLLKKYIATPEIIEEAINDSNNTDEWKEDLRNEVKELGVNYFSEKFEYYFTEIVEDCDKQDIKLQNLKLLNIDYDGGKQKERILGADVKLLVTDLNKKFIIAFQCIKVDEGWFLTDDFFINFKTN